MHELPWITILGHRIWRFAHDYHEWRSHKWKSLANHFTSNPKILIRGNECIILFLIHYFVSWIHNSTKNNHRLLISPLSLRTVFSALDCDITPIDLWRRLLALWRHICRLILHAQIRSSLVISAVNIDFSPPDIQGFSCKKCSFLAFWVDMVKCPWRA